MSEAVAAILPGNSHGNSMVPAKGVALVIPMRVSEDEEREGLDLASHGERAWELE